LFNINGKRIVVTGAASGIGEAVAESLVAGGATVVSLDRNTPKVATEKHIPVDLADPASIDSAVAQLDGQWDSLINVAGVPGTAPADVVLKVNFLGMRHLTEALMSSIIPGGSVVVVSSTAGAGWPNRLPAINELLATKTFDEGAKWFADNPQDGNAYLFSKEAATVYVLNNGLRFAKQGLRINAITPGPVETPILKDFEEHMGKANLDGVRDLVGRHATAADIVAPTIFLASPESGWVNGHALDVDGGLMGAFATGVISLG
jgi:NAD(P)-dependent dehydrogenase (short-subunit alcohol dehydrogenase family)